MRSVSSRVIPVAVAVAAAVGLAGGVSTAAAHPDRPAPAGGSEVVVFGDSYAANPDGWMNTLIKNGLPSPPYPRPTGCPQAPDNWPRLLAESTGKSVSDYSCTAQTSAQARVKLDQAVAEHAIGPGTRDVVAAVGFNDFGPFGAADGVNITDFAAVESHYVETMRGFIDAVRAVAPAARVTIVGTPAVGAAGGGVCGQCHPRASGVVFRCRWRTGRRRISVCSPGQLQRQVPGSWTFALYRLGMTRALRLTVSVLFLGWSIPLALRGICGSTPPLSVAGSSPIRSRRWWGGHELVGRALPHAGGSRGCCGRRCRGDRGVGECAGCPAGGHRRACRQYR
ncbi:hypothetical protein CXF45_09775 [Corynebacterium bovis]|nr:hypothetical protein CXF38_00135 [Corynebacterium bovis]RRO88139.1 hypothetical protein CXF45_09775 [Corynebacterium bovis]